MLKYYTDLAGQHRTKVSLLGMTFLGFTQFLMIYPVAEAIDKNWAGIPFAKYGFFSGILMIKLLLVIGILHHLASVVVFSAKRNKYEALCILSIRNEGSDDANVLTRFLDSRSNRLKFLDASGLIALPILLAILVLSGYFTWFLGLRLIGETDLGFVAIIGLGIFFELLIIVWYHHEIRKRLIYSACMRHILQGTEELNRKKIQKAVRLYSRELPDSWLENWFGPSGIHAGRDGWDEEGEFKSAH